MHAQCSAETKAGARCRSRALPGRDRCFTHDPSRADELAAARRRGGKGKANKARARKQLPAAVLTPQEIEGVLSTVLVRVAAQQLHPAIGSSVAAIAKALIAVKDASSVAERLKRLEEAAGMGTE